MGVLMTGGHFTPCWRVSPSPVTATTERHRNESPADRDIRPWEHGCSQREPGFLRYCRGRHLPAPRRGLSLTRGCPVSLPEYPEEHDRRGDRPAQIAVPARIRGTTGRTRQLLADMPISL